MAQKQPDTHDSREETVGTEHFTWKEKVGLSAKTPIGLLGIGLTTICLTLTVLGLLGHMSGLIQNPYAAIATFLVFPAGAIFGLFLIPVSWYFRRKKWFKDNLNMGHVVIDFGKRSHRRMAIAHSRTVGGQSDGFRLGCL